MNSKDISNLDPKKILVCQLRQIGDVVLSLPAIRVLKKRFPQAQIHVLTENKCAPVLENNPDIAKVIELDKEALTNPLKAIAFYWRTGRQGYDLAVDFQQLPRCRWVLGLSNIPIRLGKTVPLHNRPFYTHSAPEPDPAYAAKYKADTLLPLGTGWDGKPPRIFLTAEEQQWGGQYFSSLGFSEQDTVVSLDPTHRRITRKWPAENYAEFVRLALEWRPDLKFIVLHGPGEEQDAQDVVNKAAVGTSCQVAAGVKNLRQLAAVINGCSFHVGNCSAPRHFAVALDKPSLCPPGSSSNAWTFPSSKHRDIRVGIECEPCKSETCARGDLACLAGLSARSMLDVFIEMLDSMEEKDSYPV